LRKGSMASRPGRSTGASAMAAEGARALVCCARTAVGTEFFGGGEIGEGDDDKARGEVGEDRRGDIYVWRVNAVGCGLRAVGPVCQRMRLAKC
jgi:hypothetical protein